MRSVVILITSYSRTQRVQDFVLSSYPGLGAEIG